MTVVFPARRSVRGMLLSIVALFALSCFGVFLLAAGVTLGAWILGFGMLLEALVLLQVLRPGWHYTVGREGIGVHLTFHAHTLLRDQVVSVEAIDGARVEDILLDPPRTGQDASRRMGLVGGIESRRELSRMLAFASAPVMLTRTRTGPFSLGTAMVGARAPGRFVLVTLAGERVRILSPLDVDGFVRAYNAPER